jgi:hypothetical protein
MYIPMEEVAGVRKEPEIFCIDCADDDTLNVVESEDEIITRAEIAENNTGFFFCDFCKKAL